ncbi:HD domain-containing protein [Zoogloea sp.]|uniref:HD domain-containing protein n=1 Tax=Zoogloea sp. TaxID=49181 RepID=UPI0035B273DB
MSASPSLLAHWRPRLIAFATAAADGDGAHDVQHLHRVWRVAAQLLTEYPEADGLVVLAACYLHDLVNLPKDDPRRAQASRLAAQRARVVLAEAGFPAERLDAVAHAVEAHSFSAGIPPRSLEAQIVQDADRMDALGAVGLARMFYTAGRMGSALAHADDPLALRRPADDRAYSLDHIEVKLATLPALMNTAAARRLGEQRVAWLREFREVFVAEWGSGSADGFAAEQAGRLAED